VNFRSLRTAALVLVGVGALACDSLPGRPTEADRYVRPVDIVDFDTLYGEHCSGCHGADGRMGPARPLNDPIFLAVAAKTDLVQAIRTGKPGTPAPAFAISEGGTLSDAQIEAIATGIRDRWSDPQAAGPDLPPYSEADSLAAGLAPGNPDSGAVAFAQHCSSCHGAGGTGSSTAGSVVDGSYLALSSNQSLRSTVIAGRLDLGMPNFRGYGSAGRTVALRPQEISDIVAWLAAQRREFPGQTYPEGTHTPPMAAPKKRS